MPDGAILGDDIDHLAILKCAKVIGLATAGGVKSGRTQGDGGVVHESRMGNHIRMKFTQIGVLQVESLLQQLVHALADNRNIRSAPVRSS